MSVNIFRDFVSIVLLKYFSVVLQQGGKPEVPVLPKNHQNISNLPKSLNNLITVSCRRVLHGSCGWSTSPSCTPSSAPRTTWSTGTGCLTCRGRCRGFSGKRKILGRTKAAERQSRWINSSCSRSSRSSRTSRTRTVSLCVLIGPCAGGRGQSVSQLALGDLWQPALREANCAR